MVKRLTRVDFTNLEKTLYPKVGITKAQVIEYYIKAAPKMLSLLIDRPLVMTRFPNGVDKEGFYEKDAPAGTPGWVTTFRSHSESAKRELSYVVCSNLDTLLWLANLAALELHMTLSTVDSFEKPDLVLFDLDPKPPADMNDAVEVALLVKEELLTRGLIPYVKTSGKKGLHIVTPLAGHYGFNETRGFVKEVTGSLAHSSDKAVSVRSKKNTPGKVYVDYVQNSHGRTMVCPFSLRATPEATVSTPLDWADVKKGLNPEEFTLFNVATAEGNPWEGLFSSRKELRSG